MNIGANIKRFRNLRGLTQAELANKAGLAKITIQQYERNIRTPSYERLQRVADALNAHPYDLMGISEYAKGYEVDIQIDLGEVAVSVHSRFDIPEDKARSIVNFCFQLFAISGRHSADEIIKRLYAGISDSGKGEFFERVKQGDHTNG